MTHVLLIRSLTKLYCTDEISIYVLRKQNKHVLMASREGESLFYGLLLFIFRITYIYIWGGGGTKIF